jgi:hypothetical protein
MRIFFKFQNQKIHTQLSRKSSRELISHHTAMKKTVPQTVMNAQPAQRTPRGRSESCQSMNAQPAQKTEDKKYEEEEESSIPKVFLSHVSSFSMLLSH